MKIETSSSPQSRGRVPASFYLEGHPNKIFKGEHDPEFHWNGFSNPWFDKTTTLAVIECLKNDFEDTGEIPTLTDLRRENSGLYFFGDGWGWIAE